MSGERWTGSPKFDIDGEYSPDDFILRLEAILLTLPVVHRLRETIQENIKWAESLPPDSIIRWTTRKDGMTVPYRLFGEIQVPVVPEKPKSDDQLLN
ncbi:hypothetical protein HYS10_00240 [Candidatus Collierbacteria bacterium]|nr:hypothetical protein [Candidatus Collierbacteria bacterium]